MLPGLVAVATRDAAGGLCMLTLVPWVLVTKVFPTLREVKLFGALTSYQSFFEKGSALHEEIMYY